ncbi:polysaccharide deacetylase family protein [Radiobacillus sp. PE A8.2]|uniref:polysaccharide deacetylase family protein n=1 Tax=Radiobacillus sp. PE A8.2 TaxID=3380349 RepID=UPI0038910AD4
MEKKRPLTSGVFQGLRMVYIFVASILVLFMSACSANQATVDQSLPVPEDPYKSIAPYEGEMSKEVHSVYTGKKEVALTFSGLGDKQMIIQLLDQLDANNMKATFFVQGVRVAEDPELAREIVARGHEIENNTLNRRDMLELSYIETYREIDLSNKIIAEETGVTPKYVRTKSNINNDDVRLATAHAGLDAVVHFSINPQDWDMKDAETIADHVATHAQRGSIIMLNADKNPAVIDAIPLIATKVNELGYQIVTLNQLMEHGIEPKPLEEITGYDAVTTNANYENVEYNLFDRFETKEKQVALTFDDWGSDYKVSQILNILDNYGIKATFFLRTNNIEANPNLARAIFEAGHDVANHTYSHPDITKLSPEALQEEVVRSHQILTKAIQAQPLMVFRPPYGTVDEQSARAVAATGYKHIALYDVDSEDWVENTTAEQIETKVLNEAKSGSIILLHLLDDMETSDALPTIIETLQQRGFSFVKLSEVIDL